MARPKAPLPTEAELLERCAALELSAEEAGFLLGLSPRSMVRRLQAPELLEAWERGRREARHELRQLALRKLLLAVRKGTRFSAEQLWRHLRAGDFSDESIEATLQQELEELARQGKLHDDPLLAQLAHAGARPYTYGPDPERDAERERERAAERERVRRQMVEASAPPEKDPTYTTWYGLRPGDVDQEEH